MTDTTLRKWSVTVGNSVTALTVTVVSDNTTVPYSLVDNQPRQTIVTSNNGADISTAISRSAPGVTTSVPLTVGFNLVRVLRAP
eukprot:7964296-Pyramimonas_sp.AAC.1